MAKNNFFKDDYPIEEKRVENVNENTKEPLNIIGISETEVTTNKPFYI